MKNKSMGKKIMAGSAIVTMAAAIAGTFFLYGSKNAVKNRKKVKSWMLSAKGEILEKMENLSEINEEIYEKIVKEVAAKYEVLKKINKTEVSEFVDELKSHWKNIVKEFSVAEKKTKK